MRIYVCVKHVPDTAAKITVVAARLRGDLQVHRQPYDEYAVEEAVRLARRSAKGGNCRHRRQGAAAASMRGPGPGCAARHSGQDRLQFLDSCTTSLALKKAIERDGAPDIILTGKQSVDSEACRPLPLAQLGMPVVSDVVKLTVDGRNAVIERR